MMKKIFKMAIQAFPDNWGLPEKRVLKNRQNFIEFFTSVGRYRSRRHVLERFTPEEVVLLAKLYNESPSELEEIFSFCRKYRKTVDQISEQDISAINDFFTVDKVMGD